MRSGTISFQGCRQGFGGCWLIVGYGFRYFSYIVLALNQECKVLRLVLPCLFMLLALIKGKAQNNEDSLQQQTDNLHAFARLYGYIRFFHPSDEMQEVEDEKLLLC